MARWMSMRINLESILRSDNGRPTITAGGWTKLVA